MRSWEWMGLHCKKCTNKEIGKLFARPMRLWDQKGS